MRIVLIIVLVFGGLVPRLALASHDDCVSLDPRFPKDVATFKQRRCACYHFSGEFPYDEERKQFLESRIKETCVGLKKMQSDLRQKYRKDPRVLKVLNDLDESIAK